MPQMEIITAKQPVQVRKQLQVGIQHRGHCQQPSEKYPQFIVGLASH